MPDAETAERPCQKNAGAIACGIQWEQLLARTFLPGRVTARPGSAGRIERQIRVNQLTIAHLTVEPQAVEHTPEHLRMLPPEAKASALVHVVLGGSGFIEQAGKIMRFAEGGMSFRNLDEPSRVVFETPAEFFTVRMPDVGLIPHRQGGVDARKFHPRIVGTEKTLVDVTRRLLQEFAREDGTAAESLYASFALPWLLAGVYHGDPGKTQLPEVNATRWRQALDYIDRHLFAPEALSPAACANAIGISERYLHKLFALRGLRFSRLVLGRRLDAARELLANPAYRDLSIASIAYQSGFAEPAHFSRAFRQRFGMAPKQCRAPQKTRGGV